MEYDEDGDAVLSESERMALEESQKAMEAKVTITGVPLGALETLVKRAVENSIGWRAKDDADKLLEKSVREAIGKQVEAITTAAIARKVDEVLASPIQKYTSYGSRSGEPEDLKTIIMRQVERVREERYGDKRSTLLEQSIDAVVKEAFEKEFKPLLAEAKKKFKDTLDSGIAQRLQLALREALGIR